MLPLLHCTSEVMPAVRMFGRKWRVSSDFLPLFAGVGLVFHFFWVIFIIVWPFGITPVHRCDNTKAGRQFLASVSLFFILYVLSFIQELFITLIGLRGESGASQAFVLQRHSLVLLHLLTVAMLRHTTGDKQTQSYVPSAVHPNLQLDWANRSCQ